jgi:micrococcal nuclease
MEPNYTYNAKVVRVVDGDTIDVMIDQGFDNWTKQTLRLDGVNCPETKGLTRAAGLAATEATRKWLGLAQGQEGGVNIVIQTRIDPAHRYDSFRRYLAKVWLPGSDEELGAWLLANGHAVQWMKGGGK